MACPDHHTGSSLTLAASLQVADMDSDQMDNPASHVSCSILDYIHFPWNVTVPYHPYVLHYI